VTGERLPRAAVLRHLERLRDDLAPRQLERLRALAGLMDGDDRISLAAALEVATPGGDTTTRQDAFRQFRATVKAATAAAGVRLEVVADGRKTSPEQRLCWFLGEDTAGAELAERSRRQAERTSGDAVVAPAVAEVTGSPVPGLVTVYVSTSVGAPPAVQKHERQLLELLRERLRLHTGRDVRVTSPEDIQLGQGHAHERRRLRGAADVVLVPVSAPYLIDSGGDSQWLAGQDKPCILVALEQVDTTRTASHGLPLAETRLVSAPFSTRRTRDAQLGFVQECLAAITQHLNASRRGTPAGRQGDGGDAHAVQLWVRRQSAKGRADCGYVDSQVAETDLRDSLSPQAGGAPVRVVGQAVPAVQRLVGWATDTGGRATHLCALLGDVGIGKTTTTQLFTTALLERRETDPSAPLPLLFDLRDLPRRVIEQAANLRQIVTALLEAGEGLGPPISVDAVFRLLGQGNCVLIFDGLDEALVHLTPDQGQRFTRILWRATEQTWQDARRVKGSPAGGPGPGPGRPSRLLLSCRTHYFRSIRDEATHFTGQHRDGPAAPDYLALLMLPFGELQIREYLRVNVPDTDIDELITLIDSVHNLREIAERPLTLHMITQQLEAIERAKLAGRTVHAVDLYASFVAQWLERDNGKHSLLADHKHLLMEHLAARLWTSGTSSWAVDDVEQWLLEFMDSRHDLTLHYPARTPDVWKEDLRTATFLVRRDDDTFAFAHTSLREYFLARYLQRALLDGVQEAGQQWRMPVPSRETLAFLGQLLAGLDDQRQHLCVQTMTAIATAGPPAGATAVSPAAVLVFRYGVAAEQLGLPRQRLAGSRLDGADLSRLTLEPAPGQRLDLRGCSFTQANLTGTVIRGADLRNADLSHATLALAEIYDTDLRDADLRGAVLTGTRARQCRLTGICWDGALLYRAQALYCASGEPSLPPGWLVAPVPSDTVPAGQLVTLTGHNGPVLGGGFSPDGARILTTGYGGSARVWDAGTGQVQLTLTGHDGGVWGGGFSPDGARILTTGGDGSARVWDAGTGQVQLTLTGHDGGVWGGGFSPDGARILTTGGDGSARVWDAGTGEQTGWQLQHLPDGEVSVWTVTDRRLLGATPGAWRWLGYVTLVEGIPMVLPAETAGPLPPLAPG
jgi:hypothetical protein